ncbi:hypothetical protein LCGC14_0380550 [marine sediment metagenome]|uniref:Uncharacterized protein n=1 Tax=marine sediment metagenome TaxID=412755 RepID=A0A0F9T8D4_9ZZZZ
MAYIFSSIQLESGNMIPALMGEDKDECYICGESLEGKFCIRMDPDSFLICSERICEREGQIFDPETDIPILIMELNE